ncbi:MAG TPA: hypothetical protein VNG34_07230 [Actinomycetota bacterium]|jgi:hypothetical protein|nr:hypothetical protein [Actinomycetota bacterium]
MDGEISIRAHYERFPATIKGAFVLRGEGRDPRQVRIEDARVIEVSGGGSQSIAMEPVTLEVAPHLDLFVPFEVPLTELGAGWYSLECDVVIDGVPDVVHPGDRFPVAWPRATVRRGPVPVGKSLDVAGDTVAIDQIDCTGDSIKIGFTATKAPTLKLTADGATVPVLDAQFDDATGRGKIVGYPLMRTQRALSIDASGAKRPLEVTLP